MTRKKTAFSLIELSMVITVIAILISVAIIGGSKMAINARLVGARAMSASSPVRDIEGLAAWFDATAVNSFVDSEILSSTRQSSWWMDVGNQTYNHSLYGGGSYRPIYNPNSLNGLPSLSFNSSAISSYPSPAINTDINRGISMFAVINYSGCPNAFGGIIYKSDTSYYLFHNAAGQVVTYLSTSPLSYNNQTIVISVILSIDPTNSNAAEKIYVNGANVSSVTGNIVRENSGSLSVGYGLGDRFSISKMGEIIMYSRDLSDVERQDIESYLMEKWKITQ